ncbi:MAG: hypothetical protein ACRC4G_01850 [Alphaproteobacteria bacterium]
MIYGRKDWLPYYLTLFQLNCRQLPFCSGPFDPAAFSGENPFADFASKAFKMGPQSDPNHFFSMASAFNPASFFSNFQETYTQKFLDYSKGLQAYFETPPQAWQDMGEKVWSHGSTAVYDFAPGGGGYPVFLMAPLLLKSEMLHLHGSHSFLQFLLQEGFRPFVLDPGNFLEGEEKTSLETFCAQKIFPAYAYVLGSVSKPPLILAFWESFFAAYSLFLKQFPILGGVLLGEPSVIPSHAFSPLISSWKDHLLKPMLEGGSGVPSPLVRFLFSLGWEDSVINKMIALGQGRSSQQSLFMTVEDLLNQSRSMPLWLAKSLICETPSTMFQENVEQLKAFSKHFSAMLPEKSHFFAAQELWEPDNLVKFPLGNYALMIGSSAPSQVWPRVTQKLHHHLE